MGRDCYSKLGQLATSVTVKDECASGNPIRLHHIGAKITAWYGDRILSRAPPVIGYVLHRMRVNRTGKVGVWLSIAGFAPSDCDDHLLGSLALTRSDQFRTDYR